MIVRRSAALLATTVLAATLAACAPASAPTPTPTPTGFASEEEAFAAAEATYLAYIDALNQVDLSDPTTFEPVYALLDDDALASEKKTLTQMHADGWKVSGETEVPSISSGATPAQILVCQDVSRVTVVDAAGESRVSPDRPDIFALDVEIEQDPSSVTGARIVASTAVEDDRC